MSESPSDPRQLRDEIEQTRADLGTTVEALAAKTDVKTRAKRRVATVKQQVADAGQRPEVRQAAQPAVIAVAALVLIGVVILVVRRRR
ncbi:DUF3618 domain-containing protein [Actinoplanes sp. GCM10030250]|uniref:DUF3618 domain-containing protein n=1 Tax=Actinoplanes sp. GCM10030250 TaxID=3273376 RepID=UPI00361C60B2